jgi:hypothetical protein
MAPCGASKRRTLLTSFAISLQGEFPVRIKRDAIGIIDSGWRDFGA